MTDQELRRLQMIELEILIDFHNFCEQNNLRYFLIGGALLGAVRYQSFIPWDDDIDVAMPREDYERLKKEYVSSDKYFLQNSDSDPLFARGIQKIRRNGTEALERISSDISMHHGIYIDIFPIDYVNSAGNMKMTIRAGIIRFFLSLRAIKSGYVNSRFKRIKMLIYRLCPISIAYMDRILEMLCTKENQKLRRYAILWLHNYHWKRQLHDVKIFEKKDTCFFEGQNFSAPAEVSSFLSTVFGEDYMVEPPIDKRRQPHSYINVLYE